MERLAEQAESWKKTGLEVIRLVLKMPISVEILPILTHQPMNARKKFDEKYP
jgi:hypothetical protein